jgi:PAS domain S-box-containing protein
MKVNEKSMYENLELLIDIHPDIMIVINANNSKILAINDKGAKFLHKSKNEIIGRNAFDMIDVSYQERGRQLLNEIKKNKEIVTFENHELELDWQATFYPILNKNNECEKLVIFFKDITEQKKNDEDSKKIQEKLCYRLIENSTDMFTIVNPDGSIRYEGGAFESMTGYKPKEVIGRNAFEYILKEDHKKCEKFLQDIYTNPGISKPLRYRVHHKKGHTIYLESFFNNLIDDPIIKGYIITTHDITEIINAEKALKLSEQHFKDLAGRSPNMIFINQFGKIVYVNDRCVELMGYTKKEFLSDDFNFRTLIAPESMNIVNEAYKKHKAGENVSPYEYKIKTKKGKIIYGLNATKLIEFKGNKAILGVVADITKQKNNEREIRKTKDHLQKVIDHASEFIFTVNNEFIIKTWNATAEKITDYRKKAIINKSIKDSDVFEDKNQIIEFIIQNLKGNHLQIRDFQINTKYNTKKVLRPSVSFIKDENNNISEFLFVCRDITKEKEIHGKLLPGLGYLITDSTFENSIRIFTNLVTDEKPGLLISRTEPKYFIKDNYKSNIKVIILSTEDHKDFDTISSIDDIQKEISKFVLKNNESIILLDRIDYLITIFSFEETMKTFYKINDILSNTKSILLIRFQPSVVGKNQLIIFEEEFQKLPSQKIDTIQLDESLFNILNFINNQNIRNTIVYYRSISQEFSISKVTTQKRIEKLINMGLIYLKKKGRSKILYITDKGMNLLHKRSPL